MTELMLRLEHLLEKDMTNLTQQELNYVKKREIDQIRLTFSCVYLLHRVSHTMGNPKVHLKFNLTISCSIIYLNFKLLLLKTEYFI